MVESWLVVKGVNVQENGTGGRNQTCFDAVLETAATSISYTRMVLPAGNDPASRAPQTRAIPDRPRQHIKQRGPARMFTGSG